MDKIKEQIRSVIREHFIKEMHQNDIHFRAIMKYYDKGTPSTKKQVGLVIAGNKNANRGQIVNDLLDMDYHEILDVEKKLKYVKEYFDKKGNERVAAALPQTQEEEPTLLEHMEHNLDYGYSEIQTTYSGSASEVMFFPTGSTEWVMKWFEQKKNGTNG
jgi:hypothetical protein